MRQETYRFALDEATTELHDIVDQFEALKAKKEQIEKIVEALRPFIGLQAETPTVEVGAAVTAAAPEVQTEAFEPVGYTFMQISGPGMEVTTTEPAVVHIVEEEQVSEPVHAMAEATAEQVAYFRQPSADPFQRRIDDALWGWQQRPEGLLSPI
jgi:hypothetical protein